MSGCGRLKSGVCGERGRKLLREWRLAGQETQLTDEAVDWIETVANDDET